MAGFKGATSQRMQALKGQKLLTKSEISRAYGVSDRTITRLIEDGTLTPVRVGKIDRIAEADWLRYLAAGSRTV